MVGEKVTNEALQPAWKGTLRPADGIQPSNRSKVVIIGIGRAGNNTVTQLTKMGIKDASTIAINTDPHQLSTSQADKKILIGKKLTQRQTVSGELASGKAAIEEILADTNTTFITTDLGDRTGTETATVITEIAKKKSAITIGVVTKPLKREKSRIKKVSHALTKLRQKCDTVVVIDNNKLMKLVPQLSINETFKVADKVLTNIIKNLVEMISTPSLINLDLTEFRNILKHGGVAVVGIGESDAPNRAEEAVRNALGSPLLDADYAGATGALIYVTGDSQMTIEEANRVGEIVTESMDNNSQVIWGARVSPELDGKIRVILVMTGISSPNIQRSFGSIVPQLFNLEPYSKPEKKLPVNLGLYQLENFEH